MPVELARIRALLRDHEPATGEEGESLRAAVAVVLREGETGTELLLIRRARREGDPWSGHIAFPGGRLDPADAGPREAAMRETAEEVGLVLDESEFVGRLDDLTGHSESIRVSAFLFAIDRDVELLPEPGEVDAAFWVDLGSLVSGERHVTYTATWQEHTVEFPALRVLDDDAPVLWSMTYRFLERFFRLLGHPLPPMPWH